MKKIYYVSTTPFEATRNFGLKILDLIKSWGLVNRVFYLDISVMWEFYFPEKKTDQLINSLSFLGFKLFLRSYIAKLAFRAKLFRADIHYLSLGRGAAKEAFKAWKLRMEDKSYDELLNTEISGIPIFKILSHDASILLKIHDIYSVDKDVKEKIRTMAICVIALNDIILSRNILSDDIRPILFEGYSLNSLIKIISRDYGSDSVFFTAASHKNVSFDLVEFSGDTLVSRRRRKCKYWESNLCHIDLNRILLDESFMDIETRLLKGGTHIYSPSLSHIHLVNSPHAELCIDKYLPIVTAFTSSLDEFVATQNLQDIFSQTLPDESQVFEDQIHMLRFLADDANKKKNYCLVIRHHPRLGSAKGEVQSQYYEKLCLSLAEMRSDYVRVIMPESPISSYWLIAWSSCVVNAWSNVGLEGLRLGVPTINVFSEHKSVCYWPQTLFPKVDSPESLNQFIQAKIGSESVTSADKDRLVMAHNFYCFMNVSCYIGLDSIRRPGNVPILDTSPLLRAICDPDGWEDESFDALSSQKWTESREQITASEIASGLISLFMKNASMLTEEVSLCPLLRRLEKYQSP